MSAGSVPAGWRVVAGVLLVGVVVLSYGHFGEDQLGLSAGLLLILGGVVSGIVRIVTPR